MRHSAGTNVKLVVGQLSLVSDMRNEFTRCLPMTVILKKTVFLEHHLETAH